jgi:hypothetical protein
MMVLAGIAALLFATPSIAAGSTVASLFGGERVACSKLKLKYPDNTFLPSSPGYVYETQERKFGLLAHSADIR